MALPELLDPIQVQLLDLVSLVLARRPHRDGLSQAHINALHQALAHGEHLHYGIHPAVCSLLSARTEHSLSCMALPVPTCGVAAALFLSGSGCLAGELQGAALIRLTLQTLGSFDFGSTRLLEFVRDHVTPYLDDGDVCVRKAAAAAAAAVLHRTASAPPGSRAAAHPQVRMRKVYAY